MSYYFTSESVSEGHPDKIADQISDAILDEFLAFDKNAKVACETLVTTGLVFLAGEVNSDVYIELEKTAREVIREIGYVKSEYRFDADSCSVLSGIHEQSSDINRGVNQVNAEDQGAGDQGMMYGYATNETDNYMPIGIDISHQIVKSLANLRKNGTLDYLRPDSKAQVTVEYDENHKPKHIKTIVISTQHDPPKGNQTDEEQQAIIENDMKTVLMPEVLSKLSKNAQELFDEKIDYQVNPTGRFVLGGPHGDTGLTGRKIIVDTYGGKGAHGGGAFSGKDPSKVDRSGAYATRYVAKNLVAAGICDECLIQVSYAIGIQKPVSLYVNTFGTSHVKYKDSEIAEKIATIFDFRPGKIVDYFKLKTPIYFETAAYGHMGRTPQKKTKYFSRDGQEYAIEVELFPWEKLDLVDAIKTALK